MNLSIVFAGQFVGIRMEQFGVDQARPLLLPIPRKVLVERSSQPSKHFSALLFDRR